MPNYYLLHSVALVGKIIRFSVLTALFLLTVFLNSCSYTPKQAVKADSLNDTLQLKYAHGFTKVRHENYQELTVLNPWDGKTVFAKYYLVSDMSIAVPANGTKVKVPIQSMAATSATHFGFLEMLGQLDVVKGICSPDLIYNPVIRKAWADGKLTDLGDAFNINTEKSIAIQPELVMMSGYKQDDPYAARLIQAGIPVVYNNEWMESSLLGRAEWIRFVALFFDKEREADSLFNEVQMVYNDLKKKASMEQNKPGIMSGSNFRGTWYVPGGKSFMARLFEDAGASYCLATDTTRGSIPLQVESAIHKFSAADIWLNCNFASIPELLQADSKHDFFNPVHTGEVYNFNKRMTETRANDYWETAVVRPDLLLKDVVKILHPELLADWELYFAQKLKP